MLFLNKQDLLACLDYKALQDYMTQALINCTQGSALNFPRVVFQTRTDHAPIGFMAATDHQQALLGYKVITVFHRNREKNLNPHQGLVVCLDPDTGETKAILDGFLVTAVRTAAVSAVATHHLSRSDATTLALIGAGVQAVEHVKAISTIRPIRRLFVYSRTQASYTQLCNQLAEYPVHEILLAQSPKAAVQYADIIVTCTSAKDPLLSIDDVPDGCHINAVGACRPGELEVALFDRERLKIYLDSRQACFSESEEIMRPMHHQLLSEKMIIGELGSLLIREIPGREHDKEITLFKSVGLAIEDVFAANYFYNQAIKMQKGQRLEC